MITHSNKLKKRPPSTNPGLNENPTPAKKKQKNKVPNHSKQNQRHLLRNYSLYHSILYFKIQIRLKKQIHIFKTNLHFSTNSDIFFVI